jgi:hypothetical protein
MLDFDHVSNPPIYDDSIADYIRDTRARMHPVHAVTIPNRQGRHATEYSTTGRRCTASASVLGSAKSCAPAQLRFTYLFDLTIDSTLARHSAVAVYKTINHLATECVRNL